MEHFRFLFSLLLLCLCSSTGSAQGHAVDGIVQDGSTGEAIDFVSVALINAVDSAVVDFILTNETGRFHFPNVVAGNYRINVNRLGYDDLRSASFVVPDPTGEALTFQLTPNAADLATVEVKGYRPVAVFRGQTMIIDAAQLNGVASSNGLEILNEVPGIWVDGRNITLNGEGNVMVLLNGRRKTMTTSQAATLLESIPATNIQSVEVINGKSVKYDAEGSSGVINIITHRKLSQLYNINLSTRVRADRYLSNSHGAYVNYNTEKFSYHASANYSRNYQYGIYSAEELYGTAQEPTATIGQRIDQTNLSQLPSFSIGADYQGSEKIRYGLSANSYFSNTATDRFQRSDFQSLTDAERRYQLTLREDNDKADNLTSVDAYLEYQLDTLGSSIEFSTGLIAGYLRDRPFFTQGMDDPRLAQEETTQVSARLPLDGHQLTAQADLTKVLRTGITLEAGLKVSDGRIGNAAAYDTISRQPPVRNQALSDTLNYDENVLAAYFSASRSFGKFGLEAGVRAEYTRVTTTSEKAAASPSLNYGNLFPNLAVSYNGGRNFRGTLGFSTSLNRPNYLQLNPFVRYVDNFTLTTGNNDLLPEMKYRLSFVGSVYQFLHLNVGYLYGTDYIAQARTLLPDGVTTRISPENAFDSHAYYASVTAYYEFGQDRRFRGRVNVLAIPFRFSVHDRFAEQLPGAPRDVKLNVSTSNSYQLTPALRLEQSFRFIRGRESFQTTSFNRSSLDLGIGYELFDGALQLNARVTDVFNDNNDRGRYDFSGFSAGYASDYNTRRMILSANYKIGKQRKQGARGPLGDVDRFRAE